MFNGGYVVVNAPVGAVVPVLPSDCETVVVNGTAYHVHGGVCFRCTHGGYIVVQKPTVIQVVEDTAPEEPVAQEAEQPASRATQSWTVWIRNPNGSKTPVIRKASPDGQWIGPKGEYYDTFPTEEQLLPVYGIGVQNFTPAKRAAPAKETD